MENAFARKATAVVDEVTLIALADLLNVYAILFSKFPFRGRLFSLCYHASKNTKILSALIPRTMNNTIVCIAVNHGIKNT